MFIICYFLNNFSLVVLIKLVLIKKSVSDFNKSYLKLELFSIGLFRVTVFIRAYSATCLLKAKQCQSYVL